MDELERHESNLRKLRERAALYGIDVPLALQNQIEWHEEKIEALQRSETLVIQKSEKQLNSIQIPLRDRLLSIIIFNQLSLFAGASYSVDFNASRKTVITLALIIGLIIGYFFPQWSEQSGRISLPKVSRKTRRLAILGTSMILLPLIYAFVSGSTTLFVRLFGMILPLFFDLSAIISFIVGLIILIVLLSWLIVQWIKS